MPSTLPRFGLTGKTVPPNGVLIRFHSVVRPTLPAFSVAPITAMLFGVKKTSRGCSLRRASFLLNSAPGLDEKVGFIAIVLEGFPVGGVDSR